MTTMTQHAAGMFCWTQLGTTDPPGAKKFYSGLFGWNFENRPMGESQDFNLIQKDGKTVGALYGLLKQQRERDVPPNWESYVAVESADRTAAQVKKSGGKVVMEPFDIMDSGRMAVLQDPTSAFFSVWQAKKQIGAGIVNETGAMVWNELITSDAGKAGSFYRQVFGWTEEPMSIPTTMGGTYTVFKNNGASAGGMIQATPEMKLTHPYWLVYFAVDDRDKSVARARQLGGKAVFEPPDIPNVGRIAMLTDPQGAYFAIITPTP